MNLRKHSRTVLLWWVAVPAVVFGILGAALLGYRAYLQQQVARDMAITTPNGLQEGMYVEIGGIEQWISIRGEDRDNPVILILHGGPGLPTTPVAAWLRPWEAHFTVVHWDQRGAGKTFVRYRQSTPEMSVGRMIEDGYEVAEYLREHLHKDKITLLGMSWGAALGIGMAQARPDLFSAYVGTAQPVWDTQDERVRWAIYDRLVELARAAGDEESLGILLGIGDPPTDADRAAVTRVALSYLPRGDSRAHEWRAVRTALISPDMTLEDLDANTKGAAFSNRVLLSGDSAGDGAFDASSFTTFEIPVFFIVGEADFRTPASVVEDYAAAITAPHKELVVIPGVGHNVMLAEPELFLDALLSKVRPVVVRDPAE